MKLDSLLNITTPTGETIMITGGSIDSIVFVITLGIKEKQTVRVMNSFISGSKIGQGIVIGQDIGVMTLSKMGIAKVGPEKIIIYTG